VNLLQNRLLSVCFLLAVAGSAQSMVLTDEMALESGMTPVDEISMDAQDLEGIMNFERNEYVTTIPSLNDIDAVIKSHKQVIVINKAKTGKDAQTIRVYQDGVISPLNEKRTVTQVVDGKSIKEIVNEPKEFVRTSTGREKKETAKSGRKYFSTTPKGFFRPQRIYKMYYSNTWKTDMPNAIFINCSRNDFNKECGIAIHGTAPSAYPDLGKRASGGCIRAREEVAVQLRKLVMDSGMGSAPGQYALKSEGYRRDRVIKNSVSLDLLNRDSGVIMNKKIQSWDTVIVIYE